MKTAKTLKHFNRLDFIAEEGRQDIYHWYERRQRKYKGFRKSLQAFRIFAINGQLLRSFLEHFNFMVLLQMALAGLVTYACKSLDLVYDVHVSLFISPIVFPLAFSINTDFQRKEKVLDDLAQFKSSAMMWIFCMRDWREACSFDDHYMKAIRNKIKGLMFHLREYLFTEKLDRRKFIVRVIYEDLSDTNQINEKVRCSDMTANAPLVSRIIHFLNMMCLSFERLRVIREYRSPRSIRSFTKVLIFVLPILLSPYYVYLGQKLENEWGPYYISTMVAFVFGALQGVQDKLDDPFDGMSEDDIKLDTLDEWTFQSLEATVHRTYKVGRFQVSSNPAASTTKSSTNFNSVNGGGAARKGGYTHHQRQNYFRHFKGGIGSAKAPMMSPRSLLDEDDGEDFVDFHPYAGVLHNIKGNTTILRGGQIKKNISCKSFDDLSSHASTVTKDVNTGSIMSHCSRVSFADDLECTEHSTTIPTYNGGGVLGGEFANATSSSGNNDLHSLFKVPKKSSPKGQSSTLTPPLEFSETNDMPLSGVMSYLLNMRLQQEAGSSKGSHSRSNSIRSNSSSHSAKSSRSANSSPVFLKQNNSTRNASNSGPEFFIGEPSDPVRKLSSLCQNAVSSGTEFFMDAPDNVTRKVSAPHRNAENPRPELFMGEPENVDRKISSSVRNAESSSRPTFFIGEPDNAVRKFSPSPRSRLVNPGPDFFIGEPSDTVRKSSDQPRRKPPMVRSFSMPESQELEIAGTQSPSPNSKSKIPRPMTPSLFRRVCSYDEPGTTDIKTSSPVTMKRNNSTLAQQSPFSRFQVTKGVSPSSVRHPLIRQQQGDYHPTHLISSFSSSDDDNDGVLLFKAKGFQSIDLACKKETTSNGGNSPLLQGNDKLSKLFRRNNFPDSM